MDRGLVVGGVLICASFLIAVALNQSDREEPGKTPNRDIELRVPEPSVAPPLKCPEPDGEAQDSDPEQGAPPCY